MYDENTVLGDAAENWAAPFLVVPERGTLEWKAMYRAWVDYAFGKGYDDD